MNQSQNKIYTCPMHPEIKMSEPGNCPKCGMKLGPTEAEKDNKKSERGIHG